MAYAGCTCEPWRLRDPKALLTAVARRTKFEAGRSYLATVDLDGNLVGVQQLPASAEGLSDPWEIGRRVIEPAGKQILGDVHERPPRHVTHLIRVRDGRVVWGLHDVAFARSLLYGLQILSTFTGELIVLTPHGWTTGGHHGAASPTLGELTSTSIDQDLVDSGQVKTAD